MEYTISEESLDKLCKQNDEQAARIAILEDSLEDAKTAATSLQIQNVKLIGENARLTAAHAMQGEELVTLPRHMVYSMEDKLKEQAEEIRTLKQELESYKRRVREMDKETHGEL